MRAARGKRYLKRMVVTQMINIKRPEDCSGCAACVQACPQSCISFQTDKEGFSYPIVRQENCVECGLCQKACPVTNSKDYHPVIRSYGAQAPDDNLRLKSSSGGVFGTLARDTIKNGGVVFGVRMSDDCKSAVFDMASSYEELAALQSSKYIQSYPIDTFKTVKQKLSDGCRVLFSGTPCQINGLKLYLNKDYPNLLTVDIICHGVPSPALWAKYAAETENRVNKNLSGVNFRCKPQSLELTDTKESLNSGQALFSHKDSDAYMGFFLKNLSLRPSCFECKSKTFRLSDITLGDFWGIDTVTAGFNDRKGTSGIIIRTEKGAAAFNAVKAQLKTIDVDYKDVILKNSPEYSSVKKPEQRSLFFEKMNNTDIVGLKKKFPDAPLYKKAAQKGKQLLKGIKGGASKTPSADAMTYGILFTFRQPPKNS